jgi:Uma2 family endonuclease
MAGTVTPPALSVSDAELQIQPPRTHIMSMPVTLRRFTIDDLERFPDDGNRYELLEGVLFVTPAPLPPHEAILHRLILLLGNHLEPWPEIRMAVRSEVVLAPDNKLEPDIQIYRAGRIPRTWAEVSDRWLAVEVASRSTRAYDREYKRDAYLALDVREVWLVDPFDRVVRVAGSGGQAEKTLDRELIWIPPAPATPLRIDLAAVFHNLPVE